MDHGAIAALLVPTPTPSTPGEIRKILVPHNALEERPRALYEQCEVVLAAAERDALLA